MSSNRATIVLKTWQPLAIVHIEENDDIFIAQYVTSCCSQQKKWRIPNLILSELWQISLRKGWTGTENLTQAFLYPLYFVSDYVNQAANYWSFIPHHPTFSGIGA